MSDDRCYIIESACCGNVMGAVTICEPLSSVSKTVASWIQRGYTPRLVTVQEARYRTWGCKCNPEPDDDGGQLTLEELGELELETE